MAGGHREQPCAPRAALAAPAQNRHTFARVPEGRHAPVERDGARTDPFYVRRSSALAAATVAIAALSGAAPAAAQSTGGAQYAKPPKRLTAPTFVIDPAAVTPGATLTVRYRVAGRPRLVRVRVDLLPETGGRPAATLRLGRRPTNRDLSAAWRPDLEPGRYTARLRATAPKRAHTARASTSATLEVTQAPTPTSTGVFPIQGPYGFGGTGAKFGAAREGHVHQGQDIVAAAGTPIVAPRASFVSWRAYQADGAGHYVVLHGDDGRDYVFMHMQTGSVVVQKGQGVAAGARLGAVGATGHADGPHLHFEIWPGGWYASKSSQPIDPLPDLLAWAASG
jgi:murein DD-endopeptidase MepM/ murein hydrolase activator NlpD